MKDLIIKDYNGTNISFNLLNEECVMVNATEMAKPFNKKVNDWIRLSSTREFLEEYSKESGISIGLDNNICEGGIPASQLVVIYKGNSHKFTQGTWMHRDIALEFARWLSPMFAIWCNKQIMTLLKEGKVELLPSYTIEDPIARARAWADEQEAIRNKELQHLLELKRLEEEKEKLAISNCRQSCKIKNLRALLTIYEHKKNNDFVDEDDYPDYMTTTTRKSLKKVWWYWPLALKALTLYYGYELHRISEVRYGNQLIYPVDIFELYEEITDKYWDEIKSNELNYKGDEDWKYKSEDLAKFIIDKVKAEGREAEFMKY